MARAGTAWEFLSLKVGNDDGIAGIEHVGIDALLFESGVGGIVPEDIGIGKAELVGDGGEVVALFDGVVNGLFTQLYKATQQVDAGELLKVGTTSWL